MLIGWVKNCGLSIQAALMLVLLVFAVVPEIANAHGNADPTAISTDRMAYVDTGHVTDPSKTSSHCHSNLGQDCSTQTAFLNTSNILSKMTSFDVSVHFSTTLGTGRSLPFDPPPPRVLS